MKFNRIVKFIHHLQVFISIQLLIKLCGERHLKYRLLVCWLVKLGLCKNMGVRRGGQGGHLRPPPLLAGQELYVFRVFLGKTVSFSLFFRQKVGSCPPPWKIFALPWKKVCGRPCVKARVGWEGRNYFTKIALAQDKLELLLIVYIRFPSIFFILNQTPSAVLQSAPDVPHRRGRSSIKEWKWFLLLNTLLKEPIVVENSFPHKLKIILE